MVSKAARPRIALSKGRGCRPRIDSEREEQSAQAARHVKAKEGEKEGEGRPCSKAIKRSPIQIRNSNKKERRRKWKSRECGRSLAPAPKVGRSAERTAMAKRGLCSRKKFAGLPRLISYPSSSSSSAELMERSAMRASERAERARGEERRERRLHRGNSCP